MKVSNRITISMLAEDLKLTPWEDMDDWNMDYFWRCGDQAVEEALEDDPDLSEEDQEEIRYAAEDEARAEVYQQWHDAVIYAAEKLFEHHHLGLKPLKSVSPFPYEYKVYPLEGWEKAAEQMLETINGYGHFYFSSVDDFCDSGPYTVRSAVLSHLHHINKFPEVYGHYSAKQYFDWQWR